ncbi:MAG: hypothetical protein GF308_15455 [Candidatus Heimdallarchaeota archaeon]|nr:hypothetical protein [Candidatus Heimdallarchaeota archaeon]
MKKNGYLLIGGISALYVSIIILFAVTPIENAFQFFIRLCALLGLASMFIATMLTPFAKTVYKAWEKSTIKIHHYFTIAGLILITLHPVIFAIEKMIEVDFLTGIAVFLPDFSSWYKFWLLAGRPALIFIYIALLAALLRKKIVDWWRPIHIFNYIALVFGVVHGIMIGTDFENFQQPIEVPQLLISILFLLMTIVTAGTFVLKRIQQAKLRKRRKARKRKKEEEEENVETTVEERKQEIKEN